MSIGVGIGVVPAADEVVVSKMAELDVDGAGVVVVVVGAAVVVVGATVVVGGTVVDVVVAGGTVLVVVAGGVVVAAADVDVVVAAALVLVPVVAAPVVDVAAPLVVTAAVLVDNVLVVVCISATPNSKQKTNKVKNIFFRFWQKKYFFSVFVAHKQKKKALLRFVDGGVAIITIVQRLHVIGRYFHPSVLFHVIN